MCVCVEKAAADNDGGGDGDGSDDDDSQQTDNVCKWLLLGPSRSVQVFLLLFTWGEDIMSKVSQSDNNANNAEDVQGVDVYVKSL